MYNLESGMIGSVLKHLERSCSILRGQGRDSLGDSKVDRTCPRIIW